MRKTIVLAAAVATALFSGSAVPVEVQARQSAQVSLQVCNNTRGTALVAVSYQPIGSRTFYTEGWFTVRGNSCEIVLTTGNSYMYAYADEQGTDYTWEGDHPLCVEYPGPFAFWDDSDTCRSGQTLVNFDTLHATRPGVFTWNLNY